MPNPNEIKKTNNAIKIDIDSVLSSGENLQKAINDNLVNYIIECMAEVANLNDSDWESQAKSSLCEDLSQLLLDNYNSISNSTNNLQNYLHIITTNYTDLEMANFNVFRM